MNNYESYKNSNHWNRFSHEDLVKGILFVNNFQPKNEIEERDKIILQFFFMEKLSAQGIYRLNDSRIVGYANRNRGKQLSVSQILRRIYVYFPEFKGRKNPKSVNRKDIRIRMTRRREKMIYSSVRICAKCGSTEYLEEHHMIPLSLGGTDDPANTIYLCNSCHIVVSSYGKKLEKHNI